MSGQQPSFLTQGGDIVQPTDASEPLVPSDGELAPEIPTHELPASLSLDVSACRFCGYKARWGTTNKGNKALFDYDPPHRNHWIGCTAAQAARKAAKR